jgi:hypothetical protein
MPVSSRIVSITKSSAEEEIACLMLISIEAVTHRPNTSTTIRVQLTGKQTFAADFANWHGFLLQFAAKKVF